MFKWNLKWSLNTEFKTGISTLNVPMKQLKFTEVVTLGIALTIVVIIQVN